MTAWTILALAAAALPFVILAIGYTSCSADCCPPPPPPPEVLPLAQALTLRVEVTDPETSTLRLQSLLVRMYRQEGPEGPPAAGSMENTRPAPQSPMEAARPGPTADFAITRS